MNSPADLGGRVMVVIGGASGLGRACADHLTRTGATVVVSDIAGSVLARTVEELSGLGTVVGIQADVSIADDCRALMAQAGELGQVSGVVVAAGIFDTSPFKSLTPEHWRRVIDVNLTGSFLATQAAGNAMQLHGGAIVLFSSVAGRSGRPLAAHYAAAKAGVLSLTKSAAAAFAPRVRVNAVCPGLFRTPMWDQIIADRDRISGPGSGEKWLEEVTSKTLLGRAGTNEEIATVVAFLLSDAASFITGQAINVDGGLEFN